MSTPRAALGGLLALSALALAGCVGAGDTDAAFFDAVADALCGRVVTGRVVSTQAADADWRAQTLTLGPVACGNDVVVTPDMPQRVGDALMVMPLAVGADASRKWTLRLYEPGLEFRHYHYEPDSRPSDVTAYGGLALDGGTVRVQRFPADAATQANFTANGIARSNPNIWTLSLDPGAGTLTYALARPATQTDEARDFRAVFDVR